MIWYSRDENGVETPLTVSGGQTIQVNEMPVASTDYVGIVCQYIGATTANYTHNYFYECIEDTSTNPATYSWIQTNVQSGGGGSDVIDDDNVSTETTYSSSKIEDICSGDDTPRWRKPKYVNGVKIVTFADGTYDELIAMVNAHKAHTINIYGYLHVGDSRIIRINEHTDFSGRTIPAQYVNVTIVNSYYATDPDVLFMVKIGSGLWNTYSMDTTGNELTNGFSDSQLQSYLNIDFYGSLDSGFKRLISSFHIKNIVDSTNTVYDDYVNITLPSETEVGMTNGTVYTDEKAAGIIPFEYYYDRNRLISYEVYDQAPYYWRLNCASGMWLRSFYNPTNARFVSGAASGTNVPYHNSISYDSLSTTYSITPIAAIK